jgi:hypothetical protein
MPLTMMVLIGLLSFNFTVVLPVSPRLTLAPVAGYADF